MFFGLHSLGKCLAFSFLRGIAVVGKRGLGTMALLWMILSLVKLSLQHSRDSVVGIATGYELDDPRGRSSSHCRVKTFLFSTSSRLAGSGVHPISRRCKRNSERFIIQKEFNVWTVVIKWNCNLEATIIIHTTPNTWQYIYIYIYIYILWHVDPLLGKKLLNTLPWRQTLGNQDYPLGCPNCFLYNNFART
jgi:hypothetical protein